MLKVNPLDLLVQSSYYSTKAADRCREYLHSATQRGFSGRRLYRCKGVAEARTETN